MAFEIKGKASMDSSGFRSGIKGMENDVQSFGKKIGNLKEIIAGTFVGSMLAKGASALASAAKQSLTGIIELGNQLQHLSDQTGVSVEAFQALARVMKQAGGDENKLANSLTALGDKVAGAQGDSEEAAKSFAQLGITIQQVMNLKGPEDALVAIADAMEGAAVGSQKWAAALELLGGRKLASKMPEVLDQVRTKTLPGLVEETRKAGLLMSEESSKTAKQMMNAYDDVARKAMLLTEKPVFDIGKRAATAAGVAFGLPGQQSAAAAEKTAPVSGLSETTPPPAMPPSPDFREKQIALLEKEKNGLKEIVSQVEVLERSDIPMWMKEKLRPIAAERAETLAERSEKEMDIRSGKSLNLGEVQANQFARIGGQAGGAVPTMAGIAERELKIQEELIKLEREYLPKLAKLDAKEGAVYQ